MSEFAGKIETHQQNKREAFDGMRAYHQSEILHKGHAIEVLKTILTAILTIYVGLAASAVSGQIEKKVIIGTAIIVFIATSVCAILIVWATNRKIDHDNARYEAFREEYRAERRILGLENELQQKGGFSSKWMEAHDRKASGYSVTKLILNIFAGTLSVVSLVGSVLVVLVAK